MKKSFAVKFFDRGLDTMSIYPRMPHARIGVDLKISLSIHQFKP